MSQQQGFGLTVSYTEHCQIIGAILDYLHDNKWEVQETLIIEKVLGGHDPRWDVHSIFSSQEDSEG